jgi:leader peptidase (prepilin peptidase)/N-methyltransferase
LTLIILLQTHIVLMVGLITLLGLCVGSFLNVIIYRLPIMMQTAEQTKRFNLLVPRSHCPHCHHKIAWYHNIPLLSYWLLHQQCQHCHHKISIRYVWVEFITACLSGILAAYYGFNESLLAMLLLTWVLIPLIVIDWKTQLLPDELTMLLLWLGLLFNLFGNFVPLSDAVIGVMAGYASLWLIMQLYRLCTGKLGMGYGDFKLFSALGAWVGWQSLSLILALAAIGGIIVGGLWLKATRQSLRAPIAFGPFLAVAGWLVIFFNDKLDFIHYLH